jgi:hypothetical protein
MTLGQLIVELTQIAQENPLALNRPVLADDGDGVFGGIHFSELAYSSRDDEDSGEKIVQSDVRDKYLVTILKVS